MRDLARDFLTAYLNKISAAVPVKWDRLADNSADGGEIKVYGWIPKPCAVCDGEGKRMPDAADPLDPRNEVQYCPACDGEGTDGSARADFVLVSLDENFIRAVTSSSKHSEAITQAMFPGSRAHVDCQRVEDVLPEVEAAIKLDAPAT